jgi:Spy/CpxP family protein refolding chaperone
MKQISTLCIAIIVAGLALAHGAAFAQDAGRPPGQDPIGEQLLAPELIMQNQKAIGLTDAQRSSVTGEIKQTQGRMVDQQWELQRAVERMVELLKPDKVDEQAVLGQLDKVLATEREVKRTQLGLMMRLKNILTPEQQRTLRDLRTSQSRAGDAAARH